MRIKMTHSHTSFTWQNTLYLNKFKFWYTSLLDTAARIFLWTYLRLELMDEAVQLFCRSEGSPSPQVEWFDNAGNKILPTSSELSDYEVLNYDRLMCETNSIFQWISCYVDQTSEFLINCFFFLYVDFRKWRSANQATSVETHGAVQV